MEVCMLLLAAWVWAVFFLLPAKDGVANIRAAIASAKMTFMRGSVEVQAFDLRPR